VFSTAVVNPPKAFSDGPCAWVGGKVSPGKANAELAVITIITAITSATVTNNMMRLISASPFSESGTRQPNPDS